MWTQLLLFGICLGIFILFMVASEVGFHAGLRSKTALAATSAGPVEGAIFALLGLLLAFSFSGAYGRLDARRTLGVDEANAISTAYLRLDLVPGPAQQTLKGLLGAYIDSRISFNDSLQDEAVIHVQQQATEILQRKIWKLAVAATPDGKDRLVLPALNQMFDLASSRSIAARTHAPWFINVLLLILATLGSGLAGRLMASPDSRSWGLRVLFALALSITFYAIQDLDFPRAGFIKISYTDSLLSDLRKQIVDEGVKIPTLAESLTH